MSLINANLLGSTSVVIQVYVWIFWAPQHTQTLTFSVTLL